MIRNEELRKCVQVNEGQVSNRLTLQECRADSALQEWHWNPETRSLSNPQTGGCLTAPQIQEHESVWLQACSSEEEDREGQTWSCSKKGLLTLHGKGLHLSVRHDSSKVFLSKDRGKGSKWRTMANQTVCEDTDSTHHGQNVLQESQQTLSTGPRILTQIRYWHCKRVRLRVCVAFRHPIILINYISSTSSVNTPHNSAERLLKVTPFIPDHIILCHVCFFLLSHLVLLNLNQGPHSIGKPGNIRED